MKMYKKNGISAKGVEDVQIEWKICKRVKDVQMEWKICKRGERCSNRMEDLQKG